MGLSLVNGWGREKDITLLVGIKCVSQEMGRVCRRFHVQVPMGTKIYLLKKKRESQRRKEVLVFKGFFKE